MFVETSCDLCGSEKSIPLFVKEGFVHVRCANCGLVFVNPRLKDHIEGQVYSGTAEMGDKSLTLSQTRRLVNELHLLEKFRNTNQILEIGPGQGWFIQEAIKLGWETWAVEVNAKAIARLQEIGVHHLLNQAAESFEAPVDSFDIVRMWDVIEHLQSPVNALRRTFRSLRPGGILKLSTTNFRSLSRVVNGPEWIYLNGADHIALFEPRTIMKALRDCGFSSVRLSTRSFNLKRKLYHPEKELPPKPVLLKPFRKLIDETIRFTWFGHQMIVEATK